MKAKLLRKGIKAVATGNTQAELGIQSPHLPGAITRLGRFLYTASGIWIGAVWYSGYVNMRTTPGGGPKLVLPGSKKIGPPDRANPNAAWANASSSSISAGGNVPTPATTPTAGVGPLLASHPELKPGISRLAAVVLRRYPKLVITATTNGTHVSDSFHYKGRAVDLAADPNYMNTAAAWIARNLSSQLTEGIHNPGLSVKNGQSVPTSFWGATTWAGHANHIHLAV